MSEYTHSRDLKHSSSYRGNQHHKQAYNSSSSYHTSSHRPYNNSSSYHNSSYKQGSSSNRPYNKDQYQQTYNNNRDRYNNSGHYDKESRTDRQSSGYGSKYGSRGEQYGQKERHEYKPYRDSYYKESTNQRQLDSRNFENNPTSRKHSNSHERSRSRNKQYNQKKSERDYQRYDSKDQIRYESSQQTYRSTYNKPHYKDNKSYDSKPYTQSYQTQDKYKQKHDDEKNSNQPQKEFQKKLHVDKNLTGSSSYHQNSYHKSGQSSFKQNRSIRQTSKDIPESREIVSIQIKSRHRSPKKDKEQKTRKERNSSVSKSKSASRSKKSKRRNKKQNSSQSSSSSSSNSSSSSSSSSNRSSSSSSSNSSSSSESRSVSSRSKKNYKKEQKDFYQKKDQYQRPGFYQQSYNSSYHRDRPFYHSQKPDVSNYNSVHELKESQYSAKNSEMNQKKVQGIHEIHPQKQQKLEKIESEVSIPESKREAKQMSPKKDDMTQTFSKPQIPYNEQRYPYNKEYQRDFYKKPYVPNYQPREPYNQNRNYYNPYYQRNQQLDSQVNTQQVPSQLKTNSPSESIQQSHPPYQSGDQKPSYPYERNEFRRQYSTGFDNSEKRPYNRNYQQGYPNQVNPSQPYQGNRTSGYPYQHRFHQSYIPNRPYERSYSSNQPTQNQQETLKSSFNSAYQNQSFNEQQPYQSSFPNHFRRTFSENVGQRKYPYPYQPNDNEMAKTFFAKPEEKEDLALLQQTLKREADLKKINSLIPCSKVLELIEKARQNLTIPAIKSGFLTLQVFKEMSNFKKETMNPNLKNVLESDFEKKYDDEKKIVFQNLRLLNIESAEQENKQNDKIDDSNPNKCKQNGEKMEAQEDNQNPENKKLKQFLWKKPEMSENLRVLKSNLEMMRKATSCLSEMLRKMKMKFEQTSVIGEKTEQNKQMQTF